MDAYSGTEECHDTIPWEDLFNFNCSFESYEDLQNKYTNLHETYLREIENSKRVKKNLEKSLKYYSKLCKKFEAQKKIIDTLEKNIQEKISCLEESYKNQEKLKGLIDIYKSERSLYSGDTIYDLKRDKELLLDICCQLINESVKTNNTRNIANLILKKFKKDLNNEKLNLLRGRQGSLKKEFSKVNEFSTLSSLESFNLLNDTFSNKISEKSTNILEVKKEISLSGLPKNEKFEDCQGKTESVNFDQKSMNLIKPSEQYSAVPNLIDLTQEKLDSNNLMASSNSAESKKAEESKSEIEECSVNKDFVTLSFIKPSIALTSESEKEKISDLELKFSSQTDKNCNKVDEVRSNIKKNNNSHINNILPVSSVCSDVSDLCFIKNENPTNIVSNEPNFKNCGSTHSDSNSAGCDLVAINVLPPEGEITKTKVCQKNIALLNFKDCDHQKIKMARESFALDSEVFCNNLNKNLNFSKDSNQKLNVIENETYKLKKSNTDNEKLFSNDSELSNNILKTQKVCRSVFDVAENVIKTTEEIKGLKKNCDFDLELTFEKVSEDTIPGKSILSDEELTKIFNEMTGCTRCLSPIRENTKNKLKDRTNSINPTLSCDWQTSHFTMESSDTLLELSLPKGDETALVEKKRLIKKNDNTLDTSKNKKIKLEEPERKNLEKETNESYLDSILSAMSIQNEQLKANKFQRGDILLDKCENHNTNPTYQSHLLVEGDIRILNWKNQIETENNIIKKHDSSNNCQAFLSEKKNSDNQLAKEKFLIKKLRTFVSSTYYNKEETDKSVKECILVLSSCADEAIARVIVSIVFENVNEEVVPRERPVPPLTKTQNHLITLLSVLKTQDFRCDDIISLILLKISEKLFPDVFFWPDDSIETSSRFYIALCKHRNDVRTFWEFCFRAMVEMKQRSCLVLLVALKTWPDTLFNANSQKNNILVVTAVNIVLHMPSGNRNQRQNTILLALKRLLQGFYGFRVEDTIENCASKLLDMFISGADGADRSVILLSKCRDVSWTGKNILPKLLSALTDWLPKEEKDGKGHQILRVLRQILPSLSTNESTPSVEIEKAISCLSEILNSGKLNHESEQEIVEILLGLKQYTMAKQIIREWIPKKRIDYNLKKEIINVAADNILREMKFNQAKNDDKLRCLSRNRKRNKKSKKTKTRNRN